MKKRLTLAVVAAISLAGTTQAQEYNNQPSIYGGLGFSIQDNMYDVDNGSGWLIGGEIPITERWSGALEHWELNADEDFTYDESDIAYTRVGANYHLNRNGSFQPYLAIGIGSLDVDPSIAADFEESTGLDFGIGAKYQFGTNWFLRGDIKALRGEDSARDYLFGMAVGYAFGARPAPAPAPSAEPTDSDGDGVFDSADACRNTPRGTRVDGRGCELDDDRDGVVNSRDNCPDTAMNLAVDAQGCPITEVVEHRIELLINFDTNQSVVKPQYNAEITSFADFMEQYDGASAVIEGHTDSDGSQQYNMGLSQRRADAVMNAIIREGVPAARLSAEGYGESRPVAPNTTSEGKASNRRIEAVVEVEETVQRAR